MLTCPTCGNEEPEGSQFCGNCGAPFVPADQQPADTAAIEASALLICASCGNEEPEGSRFCGNCSAPFAATDRALAPEAPSPQSTVEQPSRVEPRPASPPSGKHRLRWVAAGAAGVLLLAAGATVAVLSLTGDGSTEAVPTQQEPLVGATSESASGDCSKPAAREVVDRLRLGDPSVADSFLKVLCGAFTGPGSQTMVVSISGPGNSGLIEWAVFRWAGGAWQFLMKQPAAASIIAAGPDIRQTLPVYRPGDSRCCPSGGTKTRIWHWNGARFTASPWKQASPAAAPAATITHGYFKTPSRNIQCDYGYGRSYGARAYVRCGIKSGLKPAPPSRGPGCFQIPWIALGPTGRAITGPSVCPGEDRPDAGPFVPESVGQVLGYGKTWSGGGLRCASAFTGLTCRNKSGHGFFLSRAHWGSF